MILKKLLYINFLIRENVNATISAMLMDDGGVFLAALVDKGGCQVRKATGAFFWINSQSQQWTISSDLCKILPTTSVDKIFFTLI